METIIDSFYDIFLMVLCFPLSMIVSTTFRLLFFHYVHHDRSRQVKRMKDVVSQDAITTSLSLLYLRSCFLLSDSVLGRSLSCLTTFAITSDRSVSRGNEVMGDDVGTARSLSTFLHFCPYLIPPGP